MRDEKKKSKKRKRRELHPDGTKVTTCALAGGYRGSRGDGGVVGQGGGDGADGNSPCCRDGKLCPGNLGGGDGIVGFAVVDCGWGQGGS